MPPALRHRAGGGFVRGASCARLPKPAASAFVVFGSAGDRAASPAGRLGKGRRVSRAGCPQHTSRRGTATGNRVLPQVKNKSERLNDLELVFTSPSLPKIDGLRDEVPIAAAAAWIRQQPVTS